MTAPIVIAAGGTGGHFFPAEALGNELRARGYRIVLMTDSRSASKTSPVFAAHEQYVLPGAGIAGRGAWRGLKAIGALSAGVFQARTLLARLRPAALIGFGGYPSVGPVLGANLIRRRPYIVLHEQNAVLGRANRFLAQRADTLALSFAATVRVPLHVRTAVTGNPVRPAVAALQGAAYAPPDAGDLRLLILGGSLGARVFSDVVPDALRFLPDALRNRLSVTQQCRAEGLERVRGTYDAARIKADLSPFFTDVAQRLAAAHLVIARAGASTVAELAVAGRPSVLVPLPGAIDNHQSANARALADAGGAWVMPQPVFTSTALAERLTALLSDPAKLMESANAARNQARAAAAARLADLVEAGVHARQDGTWAEKQDFNTKNTNDHEGPQSREDQFAARIAAGHAGTSQWIAPAGGGLGALRGPSWPSASFVLKRFFAPRTAPNQEGAVA